MLFFAGRDTEADTEHHASETENEGQGDGLSTGKLSRQKLE
jgi:hypothetical protein